MRIRRVQIVPSRPAWTKQRGRAMKRARTARGRRLQRRAARMWRPLASDVFRALHPSKISGGTLQFNDRQEQEQEPGSKPELPPSEYLQLASSALTRFLRSQLSSVGAKPLIISEMPSQSSQESQSSIGDDGDDEAALRFDDSSGSSSEEDSDSCGSDTDPNCECCCCTGACRAPPKPMQANSPDNPINIDSSEEEELSRITATAPPPIPPPLPLDSILGLDPSFPPPAVPSRFRPSAFQMAVLNYMEFVRLKVGHSVGALIIATAVGKTILAMMDIEREVRRAAAEFSKSAGSAKRGHDPLEWVGTTSREQFDRVLEAMMADRLPGEPDARQAEYPTQDGGLRAPDPDSVWIGDSEAEDGEEQRRTNSHVVSETSAGGLVDEVDGAESPSEDEVPPTPDQDLQGPPPRSSEPDPDFHSPILRSAPPRRRASQGTSHEQPTSGFRRHGKGIASGGPSLLRLESQDSDSDFLESPRPRPKRPKTTAMGSSMAVKVGKGMGLEKKLTERGKITVLDDDDNGDDDGVDVADDAGGGGGGNDGQVGDAKGGLSGFAANDESGPLITAPRWKFRFLFIVHTKAIRDTAYAKFSAHFGSFGFPASAFFNFKPTGSNAGWRGLDKAVFVFALFQSFERLPDDVKTSFSHVILDETHHILADTYRRVHSTLANAPASHYMVGMTATLFHRSDPDGTQLKDLFRSVVYIDFPWTAAKEMGHYPRVEYLEAIPTLVAGNAGATYAQLLAEYGKHRHLGRFMKQLETSLGKSGMSTAEAVRNKLTPGYVVDMMEQHQCVSVEGGLARKKRVLVFTSTIVSADAIALEINARRDNLGMRAAAAHSKLNRGGAKAATENFAKFSRGDLEVLVVVGMVNEGFDVPGVDMVVLARLTESELIYVQQLGRGLRVDTKNPDKQVTVFDLALNLRRRWKRLQTELPDVKVAEMIQQFWWVGNFVGMNFQ